MFRKRLGTVLFVAASALFFTILGQLPIQLPRPEGLNLASFEPFSLDEQGAVDLHLDFHIVTYVDVRNAVADRYLVYADASCIELIDWQAAPYKWKAYLGRHGWVVIPGPIVGSQRGISNRDVSAHLQAHSNGHFKLEVMASPEADKEYWSITSTDQTIALLQAILRLQELRPTRLTLSWSQSGGENASLLLNRLVQTLRALQDTGGTPTGVEFVPNQPDCMPKDEIGVILQDIYWSEN
ncbi:MAG: hypothetical protein HS116_11500 [Planctomycetes bacterium]|nr:hypothetical protein [Planctomycetota bacterium]